MSNLDKLALEGFLEYAKEANTRSTLAVEDGLKPVHRRILFSMAEDKIFSNKEYVKSPKIVGQILGNYHPHGDSSVYDAAVRMSQNYKMRYPLVDFKGNGGSILDPDSFAAMRYTSMRLTGLGELMLSDIEKNTVPMVENYDGDRLEPVILPSTVPNILLNGGMGIGVGISSSLVPHNLTEVCDGIAAYIKNPRITTEQLMQHIQGPDFPTGGIITDAFSLVETYETGKGTVKLRAKYTVQMVNGRNHIVITEVPYLINIEERILAPIQKMVQEEAYDKIWDIQNSTGNNKLELRIILEKDANPHNVLQTLFEKTGLETTVKINQTVMLTDGSFVTLNLRGLISYYLKHQHTIIIRKNQWELEKAAARIHIIDGLIVAIQNIDEVIALIKGSTSTDRARIALVNKFNITTLQANAILDMRLARLTSLEITKLTTEKRDLEHQINEFKIIIDNESKREEIILKSLQNLKTRFGDLRRTRVSEMAIIEKGEHMYFILDSNGVITWIPKDSLATATKKANSKLPVVGAIECNTKDTIMALDKTGKAYVVLAQDLINGTINFDDRVIQLLPIEEKDYNIFVTKLGIIKKTPTTKIKKSSQLTKVREDDELIGMYFANDTDYVMVLGAEGKLVNILVSEISSIGKLTFGSKGISTTGVLSATVAATDDLLLTVTSENKAKLTKHDDFLINAKATTGQLITDDCILIVNMKTAQNITIFGVDGRSSTTAVGTIAIKGRNSVGAKIYATKIGTIITL